jgi:hypothetical protein
MTFNVEKFLAGRSPGSSLFVERGDAQPTMEALRWGMEIRAMLGIDTFAGKEALAFLTACQRSGCAYAISPDHPEPMLNATYYAARVLAITGEMESASVTGMAEWLVGASFGSNGNVRLDVDDLFYAVRAMEAVGASLPADLTRRTVRFLKACAYSSGGFGLMPGEPPDIERTYCCAMMLRLLNAAEGLSEHRGFIGSTLRDGLFRMRPDSMVCSLATQYWGSRAAGLCRVPIARQPLREFVVVAQNPDGGYGGQDGNSTLWHTYCALRILAGRESAHPEEVTT